MFAIQNVAKRTPGILKLSQNQCRTLLGTPPRVRIPFAEKVALGVALYIGMMGIPMYVACNVRKWSPKHAE